MRVRFFSITVHLLTQKGKQYIQNVREILIYLENETHVDCYWWEWLTI